MAELTEIRGELRFFVDQGLEVAQEVIMDEGFITFEPPLTPRFVGHEVSDLAETRFGKVLRSINESEEHLRVAHPGEVADHDIKWSNGDIEVLSTDQIRVKSDSPEGLHMLKSGDQLTIFEKFSPGVVAWRGVAKLIASGELDVNPKRWANWFIKGHPALLVRPIGFDERTTPEEGKSIQD